MYAHCARTWQHGLIWPLVLPVFGITGKLPSIMLANPSAKAQTENVKSIHEHYNHVHFRYFS